MSADRWNEHNVRVGAFAFLLRSPVRDVIDAVARLYRDYPDTAEDGIPDFTVAVAPPSPIRRWFRPKLELLCDVEIPGMAPQPIDHGPLALEMGMNLQLAAGMHRFLLLHAGAVERDGHSMLMTGDSGAGKSTLTATLGWSGWRLFGDEFTLVDTATGLLHPHPRPVSLKNESADLLAAFAPADRFGPAFHGTIKGSIRHLLPPLDAIRRMDEPAPPRLILLPQFEADANPEAHRLGVAETFARLTQASTNYRTLGEPGFDALVRLADIPAYAMRYSSSADAISLIEQLWAHHA